MISSHTHSSKAQVEANRRWLAKHPEKRQEYREKRKAKEKWRKEHDPQYAESEKMKRREREKRYRDTHKEEIRERMKRWIERHPDKHKERWDRFLVYRNLCDEKVKTDAELYARMRANKRKRRAIRKVLGGGKYKPRFMGRIPDWAVKGECVLDKRSGWIAANITPEQKAYARELAIERRAAMRDRR